MRYANIVYNDLVNTDGVALSFYTQGCSHRCTGCFSKSTWDFSGGMELTNEVISSIEYVLKNYKYDYICLLGGDPMDNIDTSMLMVELCKKHQPNIKVWCYTGYTLEQIKNSTTKMKLLSLCDIIVDGRFVELLYDPTLKWRGSRNQSIIDVQESLKCNQKIIIEL